MSAAATPAGADDGDRVPLACRLQAELFRALGHPTRVQLLEALGDGERTLGELRRTLALASSSTSQHLALLRRQGLVDSHKDGTRLVCRVADQRALELLAIARAVLTANLEQHRALLDQLDAPAPSSSPQRRSRA